MPAQKCTGSTSSKNQKHSYYNDDIPDIDLLTLHPELATFVKNSKRGIPKLRVPTKETVPQFRRGFALANARFNSSPFACRLLSCDDPEDASTRPWTETDHDDVPVRDGSRIKVRVYRPRSSSSPAPSTSSERSTQDPLLPIIILIHGGGWFMGDLSTEALLARLFSTRLAAVVVNVDFRNYPDVPFGVPATDCFDAVRWTAANARRLGGDPRKGFVLAGVSGGGTFASICAHLAREEGGLLGGSGGDGAGHTRVEVTAQWLACPVFGDYVRDPQTGIEGHLFKSSTSGDKGDGDGNGNGDENRSRVQNANAPLMNEAMSEAIRGLVEYDISSPLFTPFLFEDHSRLGRGGVYVQVCGLDPWRDGARIYAGLCERAGNRTRVRVYEGLPHCWWSSFPDLKVTIEWAADCVEGMRWLLDMDGGQEGKRQTDLQRGSSNRSGSWKL